MSEGGSIRGRVLRTQLWWSLLTGVAMTMAVWLAVQHEVDELMDDSLQSAAQGLLGPLLEQRATLPLPGARAAPAAVDAATGLAASAARSGSAAQVASHSVRAGGARFVWQLVGPGPGSPVLASARGAPPQALMGTPSPGFADVPDWRVYGLALGLEGRMLYVAQSREERTEAQTELVFALVLAGLPMLLLGLLWLNARVRQDLQPLQTLSQRLSDFDPLRPGATLGVAAHDELRPVQLAIDALAARLARRLAHERAFTAHAAHALRTPLAGIDAQLAVALREAPPDLQPRLQRVRAASVRLQRVVAALLTMFRSGAEVEHLPLDLAALVARLPVEGLTLQVQANAALAGDADLLTAALLNLLDNALRHGANTVTLSTPQPGVLCVRDNGSGISPERLLALQDALAAQAYEGCMGLGLMLADLVARAHGGALTLQAAGPGFTVVLDLGSAGKVTIDTPSPQPDRRPA